MTVSDPATLSEWQGLSLRNHSDAGRAGQTSGPPKSERPLPDGRDSPPPLNRLVLLDHGPPCQPSASTSAPAAARRCSSTPPARSARTPRPSTRSRPRGRCGRSRIRTTGGKATAASIGARVLASAGASAPDQVAGVGLTGQMHGLVAPRRGRRRAAPGHPLERSAHRRSSAEAIHERVGCGGPCPHHGQARADGVHGAEGAVGAPSTSRRRLRAIAPVLPAEGLRPLPHDRRVRHRRRRRLGHVALRRRRAHLVGDDDRCPGRAAPAWLPEVAESPVVERPRSAPRGGSATGLVAGHAGRGRRRRSGRGGGRLRHRRRRRGLGDDRHLRRRVRGDQPRCRVRSRPVVCTRTATPCPGMWHLMGVMLSAGGSFRWYRDTLGRAEVDRAGRRRRGRRRTTLLRERRDSAAGMRGPCLPPVPDRRAHAARRSGCPRRVRRAHPAS